MKKGFLLFFVLCMGVNTFAKVNSHAIGARIGGDGDINGIEISYQRAKGSANRLEFDLGFASNKFRDQISLAGIYQWNFNIEDAFNWYVGPGASVGLYKYTNSYINIGIGGQIGIEYDFKKQDVPLLLSIDARPMWDLIGDHTGLGWGAALGIRYVW